MQAARQEPQGHHVDADLAEGVLRAADSVVQSVLAFEAYLIDTPARHPLPMIRPFADAVGGALGILSTAVRLDQPIEALPHLQEALHTLQHELKAEEGDTLEGGIDQHLTISQTKRIVRSLDALNQLLAARWSGARGETLSAARLY